MSSKKYEWIPTGIGQSFKGTVVKVQHYDDAVLLQLDNLTSNRSGDPSEAEFRIRGDERTAIRKALADINVGWRIQVTFKGVLGRDLSKNLRGFNNYEIDRLMYHSGAQSKNVELEPDKQWQRLFPILTTLNWSPKKAGQEIFGIVQGTITGRSEFQGRNPYRYMIVRDLEHKEEVLVSVSLCSKQLEKQIPALPKAGDVVYLRYDGITVEGKKRFYCYDIVEVIEAEFSSSPPPSSAEAL